MILTDDKNIMYYITRNKLFLQIYMNIDSVIVMAVLQFKYLTVCTHITIVYKTLLFYALTSDLGAVRQIVLLTCRQRNINIREYS
jgi:hypothetical protein